MKSVKVQVYDQVKIQVWDQVSDKVRRQVWVQSKKDIDTYH